MKILILFLVAITTVNSYSSVSIISDLDDTIKITNAGNAVSAAYNGIFGKKVFVGMSEFLSEGRIYAEELHVVTASPGIVSKTAVQTLLQNNIDFDSITYKNPFHRQSSMKFKIRTISSYLSRSLDQVVLIGDDVNHDPQVFVEIMNTFPNRVLAAYIHVVKGKDLPEGVIPYYTSFELAVRENLAHRMSDDSVNKVFYSYTDAKLSHVFPKYAICPCNLAPWRWLNSTRFVLSVSALTKIFMNFCKKRGAPKGMAVSE